MKHRSMISVEDSDTDYLALQCALKATGVTAPLERLSSGRAAMNWVQDAPACRLAERTSLLLLDLNVPGVDGLQVLKAARRRDPERHVPIIVLTTSSHPRDIARSYEAGADAYMVKPLALEDWEQRVGPLTDFWLNAGAPRTDARAVGVDGRDVHLRKSDLTRTIEREVIPRLLLAHEAEIRAERQPGAIGTSTPGDPVGELARLALEGEVSDLVAYVEGLRVSEQGIDAIFQQLIAPASRLVGDLWKTDHCDFSGFSRALGRLQQLLVEVSPEAAKLTRH